MAALMFTWTSVRNYQPNRHRSIRLWNDRSWVWARFLRSVCVDRSEPTMTTWIIRRVHCVCPIPTHSEVTVGYLRHNNSKYTRIGWVNVSLYKELLIVLIIITSKTEFTWNCLPPLSISIAFNLFVSNGGSPMGISISDSFSDGN